MKKLCLVVFLLFLGCSSMENTNKSNNTNSNKKADIIATVIKSQYWDVICITNKEAQESTANAIKLFHKMRYSDEEGTLDLLFSKEQRLWYHRTRLQLMIYFNIY